MVKSLIPRERVQSWTTTELFVESLFPRDRQSNGTSSAAHCGAHDRSSHVEGRGRDRRGGDSAERRHQRIVEQIAYIQAGAADEQATWSEGIEAFACHGDSVLRWCRSFSMLLVATSSE